jgi:hypothetical protein
MSNILKEFNVKHGALIGTNNANYVQILGSASGNSVAINAQGTDTDISISLVPKGTGTVIIPAGTLSVISGTNNGILYLNSSGIVTTDSGLTFTGTNVGIGTSSPSYKLHVVGSFAATTKSFLIDHPTKIGMKLRYGSLESPYHGVRLTGEATLLDNMAIIKLPEYIHGLCKKEGSQVQITNIRHSKIIWVEDIDIDNDNFTVAIDRDENDKKEYSFYWSFTAIRKDIEDMVVEF